MAYDTVDDAEIQQDGPISYTTGRKLRDNPIAMFAADDSSETAPRLEMGALRNPVNSDAVTCSAFSRGLRGESGSPTVMDAVIVVPGVYRIIGNFSGQPASAEIKLNGVTQATLNTNGAFDEALTCVNGDQITIEAGVAGPWTATLGSFKIKADVAVPINVAYYRVN